MSSNVIDLQKENKMGTMPMNKLVLSMSVPLMISMLVQALYNIVDSIFVSRINADAFTALNLAFPIQILIMAFGNGTAIGVNAFLSKALGSKDKETANKIATTGIVLMFLTSVLFLILGLTTVKPYFMLQNTENEQIKLYGIQYLSINCCCAFGIYTQILFERLLQSTGKTVYSMITQMFGAIINTILDPILIFGLCGAPQLGVRGAAIATVVGQMSAGILGIIFNITINKEIKISFKNFKLDFNLIGRIYSVGIPTIVMQSIGCVMNIGMNQILLKFSDAADAVFGAYYKIQSFFFMPVFGLNSSIVPIIAYNFGAGNRKRVVKGIKLGIFYAELLMVIGAVVFETIPGSLISFFKPTPEMLDMGCVAFRIIAVHFPVAAVCIILGTVFQALGCGSYSMYVSIARQLVALLPAAFLLSLLGNVDYVWFAFLIAEVISLIVSLFFFRKVQKNIIASLPEGRD